VISNTWLGPKKFLKKGKHTYPEVPVCERNINNRATLNQISTQMMVGRWMDGWVGRWVGKP
jgi:hypothetical protein